MRPQLRKAVTALILSACVLAVAVSAATSASAHSSAHAAPAAVHSPYGSPPYGCDYCGFPGLPPYYPYPVDATSSGSTPTSCATSDLGREVKSRRSAARHQLVPHGARRVVVCSYNGLNALGGAPQWGLRRRGVSSSKAILRKLTHELDSLASKLKGPVNCPDDDGSAAIVSFHYRSGKADVVKLDLGGCGYATNGHVHGWFADARTAAQLRSVSKRVHIKWPTLSGRLVKHHGAAAGHSRARHARHRLYAARCLAAERVVVFTRSHRVLAFATISHHHFRLKLARSGRFTVALYGLGAKLNMRLATTHIRVERGHTRVVFVSR